MSEELDLFDILLSPERSEEDRLNALKSLQPFLRTDEAVGKLADAIRTEAAVNIKTIMLQYLYDIDITRLSEREKYTDAFAFVACMEPERSLRQLAVRKLSLIAAHVPEVQEILTETLTNDLDPDIQHLSIQGLRNSIQKTADTINKISAFLPFATLNCRKDLLELVKQLPQSQAEDLALLFLEPLENESIRLEAIHFLAAFPVLSPAAMSQLIAQLQRETNLHVREAVIQLLAGNRQIDPAVFAQIFSALQHMPDQPELLALVAGRLMATPSLQTGFITLFEQTSSAGLKIRLLGLLNDCDLPEVIISGLKDKNPYVREAAIPLLIAKFPKFQEQIEPALADVIKTEPLTALRHEMIRVILETGRKSARTEALLVELALNETEHRLKIILAAAVLNIAVTDQNKTALLQLFREIIEGPYFPDTIKEQVSKRLGTFAYTNEPDLKKSLGLLLEQSSDIHEINTIYHLLKTLTTDMSELAPVLIQSLYRHIAYYPQEPLHEWVQLLGKLADQHASIRAELPYIISLTKANWLLSGTDKADQTGAFLPAFKQTIQKKNGTQTFMEAEHLLRDAWKNRTIKKAEVIALYKMLLSTPKSTAILQSLVSIMQEGKLVTPELVQLSLDYILHATDANDIYTIKKYLQSTGFIDLEYRERLLRIFTQENYRQYMRYNMPTIHSKTRYTTLNDWEYSGWTSQYGQWPLADLVFAIEPGDIIFKLFSELPSPEDAPEATLQYLVLEHLFRKSGEVWEKQIYNAASIGKFLELLYKTYHQLADGNALKDRILLVFYKKWDNYVNSLNGTPIPPEMSKAAAEIYGGICKKVKELDSSFNGKQFPNVLKGMHKETFRQYWPFSEEIWSIFEYKYFPKADPDQASAEKLYQQAAMALQAGDSVGGANMLKDLLKHYSHTKLVKEQQCNIDNVLKKLEQQS
jgi:hypothetical protein